jgi:ABC-type nitrate/sulfonate/bicarbonate transport system substrate-binding protein
MSDKRKFQGAQREANAANVVKAWLKGTRWAIEVVWGLENPEQKWEFIKELVAAAPDDGALASIGAGPLEDLLYGNSEEFIERVEQEALINEKFRFSLSIVRNTDLILKDPSRKEEIQRRIALSIRTDVNHAN